VLRIFMAHDTPLSSQGRVWRQSTGGIELWNQSTAAGTDRLGAFNSTTLTWGVRAFEVSATAPAASFTTSLRVYEGGAFAVAAVTVGPTGLSATNMSATHKPIIGFPSGTHSPLC